MKTRITKHTERETQIMTNIWRWKESSPVGQPERISMDIKERWLRAIKTDTQKFYGVLESEHHRLGNW